jgi:hypothetical protein
VRLPTESAPKKARVDEAYVAERFVVDAFVMTALVAVSVPEVVSVPVTARFVVVAFVDVLFVKTPVDGVVAPIEVELIVLFATVPPSMVRLLATCESLAVPMRSAKLIPKVEVATWTMVFAAPPMNVPNWLIVESPVPPRVAARIPVVSESAIPSVLVALGA